LIEFVFYKIEKLHPKFGEKLRLQISGKTCEERNQPKKNDEKKKKKKKKKKKNKKKQRKKKKKKKTRLTKDVCEYMVYLVREYKLKTRKS